MKLKSWIYIGVAILILGMISVISFQSSRIDSLKEDLSISIANEKALFASNDSLNNKRRTLQLTVEGYSSFRLREYHLSLKVVSILSYGFLKRVSLNINVSVFLASDN